MEDLWFVPDEKVERMGVFNGRTVHARMLTNAHGQMGWEVRTWTGDEPSPEGYWIAYGKIREIPQPPDFQIGRFIVEMDEVKSNILLNAIKKWQDEEIEKPCT